MRKAAARNSRACWAASKSIAKRARMRSRCWKRQGREIRDEGATVDTGHPRYSPLAPLLLFLRANVQHQRMIGDLVTVLRRDLALQLLDVLVHELDDLARRHVD